ncbi:MAG: lamin tail domain-containing protein [bacterium]
MAKFKKWLFQTVSVCIITVLLASPVSAKELEIDEEVLQKAKTFFSLAKSFYSIAITDQRLKTILNLAVSASTSAGDVSYGLLVLSAMNEEELIDLVVSQRYKAIASDYFEQIVNEKTSLSLYWKGVGFDAQAAIFGKISMPMTAMALETFFITDKVISIFVAFNVLRQEKVYDGLWFYFDSRQNNETHETAWEEAEILMGWAIGPGLEKSGFLSGSGLTGKTANQNLPAQLEIEFKALWNKWGSYVDSSGIKQSAKEKLSEETWNFVWSDAQAQLYAEENKPSFKENISAFFNDLVDGFGIVLEKAGSLFVSSAPTKNTSKSFSQYLTSFSLQEEYLPEKEQIASNETETPEEVKKVEKAVLGETVNTNKPIPVVLPINNLDRIQEQLDEITEKLDVLGQEIEKLRMQPEESKPENSGEIICQTTTNVQPITDKIIINEIAWMGTTESANNEWIELKNITKETINLFGWQLVDKTGKIKISFTGKLTPGALYLLERTDDSSVPDAIADGIYKGGLNNTDEALYLFDPQCQLKDKALAESNWPAGDNKTKRTMERKFDFSWQTSEDFGGTPNQENSAGYSESTISPNLVASPMQDSTILPKVLISEVAIGIESSGNEFIELYNPNNYEVNLSSANFKLKLASSNNNVSNKTITWLRNTIPAKGYFLLVGGGVDGISADATFSPQLTAAAGVIVSDKENSIKDAAGWGECSGADCSADQKPAPLAAVEGTEIIIIGGLETNQSLERIKDAANDLIDTNNNSLDFILNNYPSPTNSLGQTRTVDYKPPVRSNGQPAENLEEETTETIISITTDEVSHCRYSQTSGLAYDLLENDFSSTDNTFHSSIISGLIAKTNYFFYVKCQDPKANTNSDDFIISFSTSSLPPLNSDVIPPVVYFKSIPAYQPALSFDLSWTGEDPEETVSASGVDGFILRFSQNTENWNYWPKENEYTEETTYLFTGLSQESYYFQLKAKDNAGNESEWLPAIPLEIKITLPLKTVAINEIAWMGTLASNSDEWLELHNTTDEDVDIINWSIFGADTEKCLNFSAADGFSSTTIPAKSYFIYANSEETIKNYEGNSLVDIWDASIGMNNNSPGQLILYDGQDCQGNIIDGANQTTHNWFAGKSESRITMEKVNPYLAGSEVTSWQDNNLAVINGYDRNNNQLNGTPKAQNSAYQPFSPSPVSDLTIDLYLSSNDKATLSWTSPENNYYDDLFYDIRYLINEEITAENWDRALIFKNELLVLPAGNVQMAIAWPLNYNKTYYFAVKIFSGTNYSILSNVVSYMTGSGPEPLWPMAQQNSQRNGNSSFVGPALTNPSVKWVFPEQSFAATIGPEGIIYVGGNNGIYSIDPETGEENWLFEEATNTTAMAIGNDGAIYAIANSGLISLDRLGNKLWEYSLITHHRDLNPAIFENKIYFLATCLFPDSSLSISLFKMTDSGGPDWIYDLQKDILYENPLFNCGTVAYSSEGAYTSSPTIDSSENIYFGINTVLYSFNNQGKLRWKREFPFGKIATPAISNNDIVYISGVGLEAINPADGTSVWPAPFINSFGKIPLAPYNENVYGLSTYEMIGHFFSLNASGELSCQSKDFNLSNISAPLIDNQNNLYALISGSSTSTLIVFKDNLSQSEEYLIPEPLVLNSSYLMLSRDNVLYLPGEKLYAIEDK